jgi:hypothetical protein
MDQSVTHVINWDKGDVYIQLWPLGHQDTTFEQTVEEVVLTACDASRAMASDTDWSVDTGRQASILGRND